jgi:hypothetical protein
MFAAGLATCTLDPVHDKAVADLGPEAPGVSPGALHRPNQPCLTCHDGSTASTMSVAGTVYGVLDDARPLEGATVTLTDTPGTVFTATTNAAGNFYVMKSAWEPIYPLHVEVALEDISVTMSTIIGRDGSCASCHTDPPTRISAGRIYLVPVAVLLPDGGSP